MIFSRVSSQLRTEPTTTPAMQAQEIERSVIASPRPHMRAEGEDESVEGEAEKHGKDNGEGNPERGRYPPPGPDNDAAQFEGEEDDEQEAGQPHASAKATFAHLRLTRTGEVSPR